MAPEPRENPATAEHGLGPKAFLWGKEQPWTQTPRTASRACGDSQGGLSGDFWADSLACFGQIKFHWESKPGWNPTRVGQPKEQPLEPGQSGADVKGPSQTSAPTGSQAPANGQTLGIPAGEEKGSKAYASGAGALPGRSLGGRGGQDESPKAPIELRQQQGTGQGAGESSSQQVLGGILRAGEALTSAASSAGASFNKLVRDTPRHIPFATPKNGGHSPGANSDPDADGSTGKTPWSRLRSRLETGSSEDLASARENLPRIKTKLPPETEAAAPGILTSVAIPVGKFLGPGVGKLQAALQEVSLKELLDGLQRVAQARRGAVGSRRVYPNRKSLSSVQDFFMYAEAEGRRLFDELDFDCDGQVTLQDLEHAMRKRRLPRQYAREMLRRTKRHWLAKSFGWKEFQGLMEQREPSLLKAFTSLSISDSGTLKKEQILSSLKKAGLPATDDNARAMMRFLDADGDRGQITYGQFRNFLLLLPPERLSTADPSMIWFEAATVVSMAPPPAAGANVLRSALAGGLASGLSTCLMHPLDTIKTRVQASSASLSEVIATVPQLGLPGLYRGATPAILGQFASHGLRTGVFEATRMLMQHLRPELREYQIQPVASFCSTVLGTAIRIPCEVLKQRLQAGMFDSIPAAVRGTLREDGVRGLFRGTTATLLREVPFYVFGMLIYLQVKDAVKSVLRRDLAPWESLLLGGVSGGLAAVAITPFDVIKTRMMVAPKGAPTGLLNMGVSIVAREGVGALYKGALPRFFWIAPLGAMNFAGYELAKQAMEKAPAAV